MELLLILAVLVAGFFGAFAGVRSAERWYDRKADNQLSETIIDDAPTAAVTHLPGVRKQRQGAHRAGS